MFPRAAPAIVTFPGRRGPASHHQGEPGHDQHVQPSARTRPPSDRGRCPTRGPWCLRGHHGHPRHPPRRARVGRPGRGSEADRRHGAEHPPAADHLRPGTPGHRGHRGPRESLPGDPQDRGAGGGELQADARRSARPQWRVQRPHRRTATFLGAQAANSGAPRLLGATSNGPTGIVLTLDKPLAASAGDQSLYSASTGNTTVVAQFSKPMADATTDPSHFVIAPAAGGAGVVPLPRSGSWAGIAWRWS